MSSKALSPGAQLLRHSRLLSLPPQIPPANAYTSIYSQTGSCYPTHQVISTPTSSHCRGDWGLKRNLPLKVTQKYLKYGTLDTIEHRTTFESAHGEVMTLRRWQEMDIPLTRAGEIGSFTARSSAFEEIEDIDPNTGKQTYESAQEFRASSSTAEDDSISPSVRKRYQSSTTSRSSPSTKWRFQSPYLQSLSPPALRAWLLKKVRPRRQEFIQFIKRHHYLKDTKLSSTPNHEPTQQELDQIQIDLPSLRNDPMYLEQLIVAFLDLPMGSPPPATHPSAGLHYIRSSAYMQMHPFNGPQVGPPTPALPGRQFQSKLSNSLAGIGGIVAKVGADVMMNTTNGGIANAQDYRETMSLRENREVVRWYRPIYAGIDSDGRIALEVCTSPPPEPGYIGPGADVLKPVVEEMERKRKETEMRMQAVMRAQENRARQAPVGGYPYRGMSPKQMVQQRMDERDYYQQQQQQPPPQQGQYYGGEARYPGQYGGGPMNMDPGMGWNNEWGAVFDQRNMPPPSPPPPRGFYTNNNNNNNNGSADQPDNNNTNTPEPTTAVDEVLRLLEDTPRGGGGNGYGRGGGGSGFRQ